MQVHSNYAIDSLVKSNFRCKNNLVNKTNIHKPLKAMKTFAFSSISALCLSSMVSCNAPVNKPIPQEEFDKTELVIKQEPKEVIDKILSLEMKPEIKKDLNGMPINRESIITILNYDSVNGRDTNIVKKYYFNGQKVCSQIFNRQGTLYSTEYNLVQTDWYKKK